MSSQILISDVLSKQRQYFRTGTTKNVDFRITQLQSLKKIVVDNESAIIAALKADLNKPLFEAYTSEFSSVIQEIDYALKNIKNWVEAKKTAIPFSMLPASAKIIPEPLGIALIIGPWNYPFTLNLMPLIGAIAAGNCTVVKPSEFAPHTSKLIAEIISKNFPQEYIKVFEGDVEVSKQLLQEKFDHIFFTGGTATGKIIMAAAAKHLTPVTLELGGKSPCIVDKDIDLEVAARRIAWGKFYNAGQTCIAPDYVLIHQDIKAEFVGAIEKCIQEFYGENPKNSPDYARIINQKQFSRAANLIQGDIRIGGETNADEFYISPTVIDNVSWEDTIMQDEIFAPILPIIEYTNINDIIDKINLRPKPLALYLFSKNKNLQKKVLCETSSGGVCINDVIKQVSGSTLPFGGVGDSGIGSYHGKASFDTFSHYKSVVTRPFFLDAKILYAPYEGKLSLLKKLLG
ncbi:aldehyde dehydrogenase [Brunnivagina elsteri]|uniref:Aldehyde dehydrogenase n=1 Tax=Brunnivagina elsteri CCALA 953 TaxID=987040 RepID=A0A2A2TMU9_9CYAN|nr:aldehyde dehydrogenase [Calothrix elsteri]PAX59737.1 aldehyde dehydrogenase family protein [Calothrix elsteri CCALA 953]